MGSVMLTIAAIATAASAAFPPALSMSLPTAAARGWLEQAMPFFPKTGARWELNGFHAGFRSGLGSAIAAHMAMRLFRHKHILARKLLKDCGILRKVGGKDIDGISGNPLGQVNGLIVAAVKDDEDTCLVSPDVFNGVTEALRDIADISLARFSWRQRPCEPKSVTLKSPLSTYCHSEAFGCQCSSRRAPGSISRTTPSWSWKWETENHPHAIRRHR